MLNLNVTGDVEYLANMEIYSACHLKYLKTSKSSQK